MPQHFHLSDTDNALPLQEACLSQLLHSFRPQSSGSILRKLTSHAFGEPSDTTVLPPVILCIGTDRLIGDSLGPLTGSLLQRAHCPLPVYGTLAQPVHALNLADFLAEIRRTHSNSPVIAIDASLGPDSRIGCLTLRPHGLQPGAGVHKILAPPRGQPLTPQAQGGHWGWGEQIF